MKIKRHLLGCAFAACTATAGAQIQLGNEMYLSGSLQSDILFPQEDESIGTGTYDEWGLTNTYLDMNFLSKYVMAGARFEYLEHPLPGFERDFAGWGVPHIYVTGKYKGVELTVGDFYDQFGNGFIYRTYEERSLGVDNSLRGARLVVRPFKGINIKVLGGKQRYYWRHDGYLWQKRYWSKDTYSSYVFGADAELNVEQWFKRMQESNTYLTLGLSYVGRQEDDEVVEVMTPGKRLNLPGVVNAYDFRAQLQKGDYNFMVNYALKGCDPSSDNYYIYKNGSAFMVSGTYSKRGMSLLLQAKRSDNMSFRSRRTMNGVSTASFINNLPVFAYQHTYSLATLYPYSTQAAGEWAFQGEFSYNFKRRTPLGGRYGTTIKMNFSHIRSIYGQFDNVLMLRGQEGPKADFFDMKGGLYYQDAHIAMEKKLTKDFKLNLMYINQLYNPAANNHADEKLVHSNIFIAEGKYQINQKLSLRAEVQYLLANKYETYSGQEALPLERSNQGDWVYGLVELAVAPSLMFSVSDMYNIEATKEHYYNVTAVYTHRSHRLQVGYGRTRKGYTCTGGVCREVPASKGCTVSYTFNF